MLDRVFAGSESGSIRRVFALRHGRRSPGGEYPGMLAPRSYGQAENWQMRTECLVAGTDQTVIDVRFGFFLFEGR